MIFLIKTIFLIILSFFAVIGLIECLLTMIETISIAKYDKIKQLSIVACLDGEIEDVNFLLNTLILQAEKINYKNVITKVVVKDVGLSDNTYHKIYNFCLENDNITVEK